MEKETLATELLHELKASNRRWFIAFIVVLSMWLLTIGGFIWYISLPVEEVTIEQESDDDSYNQIVGGDYNGTSESDIP
jgi:hypothetical protein